MSIVKFTVDKIGRKWCHVTIHGKNSTYKAQMAKTDFPDAEVGKTYERNGRVDAEGNKFGSTYTLILQNSSDSSWLERDIQKNIDIIRKCYNRDGYVYEQKVNELHRLGCKDYDQEIQQMRIEIVRKRFNEDGYVYEKGVEALHKSGCRAYDQEIQKMRATVAERRITEREAKRRRQQEADLAAGIRELRIPAYWGFNGKPQAGEILVEKGIPYRVISSYYHDADGYSFGIMNEEWYSVRAQDISDTSEGKQKIACVQANKALTNAKQALTHGYNAISGFICTQGERYVGEKIDLPQGEVIYDSMDAYGCGYTVISCDDGVCWLICNNGSDGDDWSLNNIRTGGAGAYGYFCKTELVADYISDIYLLREGVETAERALKDAETKYLNELGEK